MANVFGPKLGLLFNSNIGETYYDQLRQFLQAIDQLIMGSVINATTVVPPASPNPGDAYLLSTGTPSGAWTGQLGKIAVWDTQVTNSGTNVTNPSWVFYSPNPGWIVWNVALSSLIVYNGTVWNPLTGGANYPTNTNITSMTGIPSTTLSSVGYVYNDGTNPIISIGDNGTGSQIAYGSTAYATNSGVIIGDQAWTGSGLSGYGAGFFTPGQSTVIVGGSIYGSGTVQYQTIIGISVVKGGQLQVGTGSVGNTGVIDVVGSANVGLLLQPNGITTLQSGVLINSGTGASPVSGAGLLGFDTNYPTQTTVGAAGGASALPATPTGYLQIAIHGTQYVMPYYAHA